jgi:hypothetical protein
VKIANDISKSSSTLENTMPLAVLSVARRVSLFAAFAIVCSASAQQLPGPERLVMPKTYPRVAHDDPKPLTPAQLEALARIKQTFVTAEQGDDELRKLLKERYSCALVEYELSSRVLDFVPDKSVWLDKLISAHRMMVKTALELLTSPEEQVLILDEFLRKAIELDKNLRDRTDRGLAMPQDYARAHGIRLDAEIALLKAKRKIKADK